MIRLPLTTGGASLSLTTAGARLSDYAASGGSDNNNGVSDGRRLAARNKAGRSGLGRGTDRHPDDELSWRNDTSNDRRRNEQHHHDRGEARTPTGVLNPRTGTSTSRTTAVFSARLPTRTENGSASSITQPTGNTPTRSPKASSKTIPLRTSRSGSAVRMQGCASSSSPTEA